MQNAKFVSKFGSKMLWIWNYKNEKWRKMGKNGMQRRVKAVCGRFKNVTATTTAVSGKWKGAATTHHKSHRCRGVHAGIFDFYYLLILPLNEYLFAFFVYLLFMPKIAALPACALVVRRLRRGLHVLGRSLTHLHAIMNWYFFLFLFFLTRQRLKVSPARAVAVVAVVAKQVTLFIFDFSWAWISHMAVTLVFSLSYVRAVQFTLHWIFFYTLPILTNHFD